MWYVVIGLVFVAGGLFAYGMLAIMFAEERKVTRVLRSVPEYESQQMRDAEPLLHSFVDRALRPLGARFVRLVRRVSPADAKERARRRLVTAGNPRGLDADRYQAAKVLVAVLFLAGFAARIATRPSSLTVFLALIVVPAAYFLPDAWLSSVISKRKRQVRKALPEMLDMLTISVEAGLGFDAALTKLIRNTSGPLAQEFARMLQEVQAGVTRKDALRSMAERVDVPELDTFIMAMVQADVFGVSVSKVLKTQSAELRLRRRQSAEEIAQKSPVKVVFPVIFCILPATLLVVVGPAVLTIGRQFGLIGR